MPKTTRPKTYTLLLAALGVATFSLADTARAQNTSAAPILQWFESSYEVQEERVADFFMAGYGSVWIPPTGRADSGNQSVGYDVYNRFDLGGPGSPTLYGTQAGLTAFADQLHLMGGNLIVDLIWNHNGFSDSSTPGFQAFGGYPGFVLQDPDGGAGDPFGVPGTDGDFHGRFDPGDPDLVGRLAGLIDINHTTNHQFIRQPVEVGNPMNIPPGSGVNVPDPANAQYYPDLDLDPIMVFNPLTGQNDIPIYPFNLDDPMAGDAVPENALGLLMRNVQWMIEVVGVDGFRLDAARHFEPWVLAYFDQAVYRASDRTLLDGSQYHGFSFSEAAVGDVATLFNQFVRDDIDPNDPGRVGGNRDALDFAQFRTIHDNLQENGQFNDWRNVVYSGVDYYDDGLINGSSGVVFVESHDDFGPAMQNVAYAYSLMRPGNAIVYYNALQHGDNRDFPKQGRGDALGNYGDTITTLLDLRNSHGRGDYRERWLDQNEYAFERSGAALVLLSNRNDGGFDARRLLVDHAPGTYLIELTGNAARWNAQVGNSDIPELIQVFDDNGNPAVDVRFLRNNGQDQGYLVYGLATPQSADGLEIGGFSQVLEGGDPDPGSNFENAVTRLTDLYVISDDSFTVSLATQQVNLLGVVRDRDADGDNAVIKVNEGIDLNGSGAVDYVTPGSVVYGFEEFGGVGSVHDPGYFNEDGNGFYQQTIDATVLPEGQNYITVRAFRHRDDGGPAVFTDFRSVVYVDRLDPESAFDSFVAFSEDGNDLDFRFRSTDQTADAMHFFLNLGADLSEEDILAMVSGDNQADQIDRDLFQRGYFDVQAGNNVVTVVTFEQTGSFSLIRHAGLDVGGLGAGLGDINADGTVDADDLQNSPFNFETVLYSQDALFNPAADVNADGRVDNRDLYGLRVALDSAGVSGTTQDAYTQVLLRRGNINGAFGTDAFDIDALYDSFGSTDWFDDLDVDGTTGQGDVDTLVRVILGTEYGDANLDGSVDEGDLDILDANWMQATGWAGGDFTGDDTAEWLDLALIGTYWQGVGGFLEAAEAAGVVIVGDLTGDGFVGVDDLNILLANWGDDVETFNLARGDLTGDGRVTNADLQVVLGQWGDGTPPDVNIPEPGTLTVLTGSLLCLLRRRRR